MRSFQGHAEGFNSPGGGGELYKKRALVLDSKWDQAESEGTEKHIDVNCHREYSEEKDELGNITYVGSGSTTATHDHRRKDGSDWVLCETGNYNMNWSVDADGCESGSWNESYQIAQPTYPCDTDSARDNANGVIPGAYINNVFWSWSQPIGSDYLNEAYIYPSVIVQTPTSDKMSESMEEPPHGSNDYSWEVTYSDEATDASLQTYAEGKLNSLPSPSSLPWGAHVTLEGMSYLKEHKCGIRFGNVTAQGLAAQAASDQATKAAYTTDMNYYQGRLQVAQQELANFEAKYLADHQAWKAEMVAWCRDGGNMPDNEDLLTIHYNRKIKQAYVAAEQMNMQDAIELLTPMTSICATSAAMAGGVEAGKTKLVKRMDRVTGGDAMEQTVLAEDGYVYGANAEFRIRVSLPYFPEVDETWQIKVSGANVNQSVTIAVGSCFAYGAAFTTPSNTNMNLVNIDVTKS